MRIIKCFLFVTTILILVGADKAYAYLDLGTGSYIAQAIISAIVMSLFFLKSHWLKFKKFVMGFFKRNSDED
jgi:O-antigen/teichoic acid export membrane protein